MVEEKSDSIELLWRKFEYSEILGLPKCKLNPKAQLEANYEQINKQILMKNRLLSILNKIKFCIFK